MSVLEMPTQQNKLGGLRVHLLMHLTLFQNYYLIPFRRVYLYHLIRLQPLIFLNSFLMTLLPV